MMMMFVMPSCYTTLLLGMAFGSLFQVLSLFTLIFVFEDYVYSKAITTINDNNFSSLKTSDYGSISLDSSSYLGL